MTEAMDLSGKTAVVTGASSGIGLAIGRHLADAGAHVYMAGRNKQTLDEALAASQSNGAKYTSVVTDVRNADSVKALVKQAMDETGRLDIMVNNAGLSYPEAILDGDPEHWREMFEVNVLGLLAGCQAAAKAMRECKAEGHIVNISSVAARAEGAGVYGSTKAAVSLISRTLRNELENDTIRVVNICPGAVVTNFARNFPPQMVAGLLAASGEKVDFVPGEQVSEDILDKVQKAARQRFASADDVARAVVYAVNQPIELNIFELEIRPQMAFRV